MSTIQARFSARDRSRAKQEALRYWVAHRDELGITLREFNQRCVMLGDGTTILLLRPQPTAVRA